MIRIYVILHRCIRLKKPEHKRLTVDLGVELFSQIKAISALRNMTLRALITYWLFEKVKEHEELNQ